MLNRTQYANGLILYHSPLLQRIAVPHAFTTRLGGVSAEPFASLNLGNPQGGIRDSPSNLEFNHSLVQRAIACTNRRRRWVTQVHGPCVTVVDDTFVDGSDADGLLTDDAGDLLAIRVADCTPILLATEDGRAVGAIHAGWRGVVSNTVPNAVSMLNALAGTSSEHLIAAIGPCIGPAAFEVGPEVWSIFQSRFGKDCVRMSTESEKAFVDLRASIVQQLVTSGLQSDSIDVSNSCTLTDESEFFSHRRDHGVTGRMAAFIGTCK